MYVMWKMLVWLLDSRVSHSLSVSLHSFSLPNHYRVLWFFERTCHAIACGYDDTLILFSREEVCGSKMGTAFLMGCT